MDPATSLPALEQELQRAVQAGDQDAALRIGKGIRALQQIQAQPSVMDNYGTPTARDVTKGTESGAVTGLIGGTIGAPGDLAKAATTGLGMALPKSVVQGGQDIDKALGLDVLNAPLDVATTPGLTSLTGTDYSPGTEAGKMAKAAASGAAGFAVGTGGVGAAVKRALLGGGIGAVDEKANQVAGVGSPLNALAAAVLSAYAAKKPREVAATQDLVKDVGEQGLRDAASKVAKMTAVTGAPGVITQGLDFPTAMTALTQDVMQSAGSGAPVRRAIEAQGPIGRSVVDDLISGLTSSPTDQTAVNKVVAAGDTAIKAPNEAVTAMTKPFYQAAAQDTVPGTDIMDIIRALSDERQGLHLPPTSDSGRAMTAVERKVAGTVQGFPNAEGNLLLGPDGKPLIKPTSVLDLDTLAKEASAKAAAADKPTSTGADIAKKMGQQGAAAVITDATREASPALAAGKDLHQAGMEQLVQPVQQSALTTMFPQAMRDSGKGNWDVILPALDGKGSDITGDINKIYSNLNSTDPNAFPTIAKRWLESKREAADSLVNGRENPNYFGNFVDSTAGTAGSNQRKNFTEIIKGVASAQGRDPELAAQGANDLMDSLQVMARERSGLGKIDTRELERASGANPVTGATRMVSLLRPFWSLGNAVERHVFNRTYQQVADALTTPAGVDKLIDIANYGAPNKAAGLAQALMRGNALQQGEQ